MSFDDLFVMWDRSPKTTRWSRPTETDWVIFEYIKDGIHYHASFMMETKTYRVFKMKKWPWANGKGFGLEIDKRLDDNLKPNQA